MKMLGDKIKSIPLPRVFASEMGVQKVFEGIKKLLSEKYDFDDFSPTFMEVPTFILVNPLAEVLLKILDEKCLDEDSKKWVMKYIEPPVPYIYADTNQNKGKDLVINLIVVRMTSRNDGTLLCVNQVIGSFLAMFVELEMIKGDELKSLEEIIVLEHVLFEG